MKTIPLFGGKEALVDDDDYERLVAMGKWHLCSGYASKYTLGGRKNRRRIRMHCVIMDEAPRGNRTKILVDHINRDKLDNRKANLRITSRSENNFNRGQLLRGCVSLRCLTVKGTQYKYWVFKYGYKPIGYYKTEAEAWSARLGYLDQNNLLA